MRMMTVRASVLLGALTLAGTAFGQSATPPLATFVNNSANGATPLQQATGIAVQNMCVHLATREGATPTSALAAPKQDAFLRCNELVQTANQINNNGQVGGRSLNLTGTQLLGALLQGLHLFLETLLHGLALGAETLEAIL